MSKVEVLKFGSSVLRSSGDLPIAVDEIYRRWRSGFRVLAVVSAFENVTNQLLSQVSYSSDSPDPEAVAAYVATGEQKTAALLLAALRQHGLPARLVEPRQIHLLAEGPLLESAPVSVERHSLERLWTSHPILVLPGFYGIDAEGRYALFGRGGSDLSAVFLAATLGSSCRLVKDVPGVFDADPARSSLAHRFSALSWERAIEVAGPLIQSKALHYARERSLAFEVGRPNEEAGTKVGHTRDEWAAPSPPPGSARPLRIALLGCGVVGRGVYEAIKRYPTVYELRHVVVRSPERYHDIDRLTTDPSVALDPDVDVVIVCFGGVPLAYSLILNALSSQKFVITANKSAIAHRGNFFGPYTRGPSRRLWCSAAVGGAMPALETIVRLKHPVHEIRGVVNSTCGAVLHAMSQGKTRERAIAEAQAAGFAEKDPSLDLSGRDSADKLSLLIEAAFGSWIPPETVDTHGIDTIPGNPTGYKLIARALRASDGNVAASVSPECPPPGSFLAEACGPENCLEIELVTGEIVRLKAQGAGRWPTTVSVLGDLHEIARLAEVVRSADFRFADGLRHTGNEL